MKKPVTENNAAKAWAADVINLIHDDLRQVVICKESYPIADLKDMLVSTTRRYPDNIAFLQKWNPREGYDEITYSQTLSDVNSLGTALLARGLKGERVAVIGANCYQWITTYLAVTGGVGCIVPLDRELNREELKAQIKKARVSCAVVDKKHLEAFKWMRGDGDTDLRMIVDMESREHYEDVLSWTGLIQEGKKLTDQDDMSYINAEVDGDAMSVLLFTSGTTDLPKAVMLSQKNICFQLMTMPTLFNLYPEDRFFSFLPIHHTFECICGVLLPLYKGASVAFSQGLKYITRNLKEVRPTVLLSVPSFYEKLYHTIWKNLRKQGRADSVRRAKAMNRFFHKVGADFGDNFFKDIKYVFGGRLKTIICGGAIADPKVLDGLSDMGFYALQGYGLTEASPAITMNPPGRPKSESLGVAFPGHEIKIYDPDPDGIGEICVRGGNVMLGYYEDPEATAEVIDNDGWLHTGDVGYADSDRYYYLTGRSKNIIITKNGKNVYPEEIEDRLNRLDFVEESFVYEDKKASGLDTVIVAAVKVKRNEVARIMGENFTDEDVKALIWAEVDKINKKAPAYRRINKVILRKSDFVHNTLAKLIRDDEGNKKEE